MADAFTATLRSAQRMFLRDGTQVDATSLRVEPPRAYDYKASGYWFVGQAIDGRELTDTELDQLGEDYQEALYEATQEAARG